MQAFSIAASGIAAATARFDASARRIAPVTDLDAFYDAWQERLNSGDLEGLVDLYVEDVTYVNSDKKLLHGKAQVRADFEGLFAIKPQIVLGNRKHVIYQDIVLTTNHWRMNFTNADGIKQELTGGGIEVMRNQREHMEAFSASEQPHVLVVDTEVPVDAGSLQRLLASLRR